jgi:hypothetical protein
MADNKDDSKANEAADPKDEAKAAPKDEAKEEAKAKDASSKSKAKKKKSGTGKNESAAKKDDSAKDDESDAEVADAKEQAKDKTEEKPAAEKAEVSSPWPSKRKSDLPPKDEDKKPEPKADNGEWPKYAWGEKLFAFDKRWTKLEARLLWWVLAAEIFALVFTVLIGGLATDPGGGAQSGIVLRSILGATVLGLIANRVMRDKPQQKVAVIVAVVVGLLLGPRWANFGVQYFGNIRNWLQNASILLLVGGVSQLAKRLTLWLALLGASVATAQGKHINVDVVMRFLSPKARVPVAVIGWIGAGLVSFASVFAFFDELAIADYKAHDTKPCVADQLKTCETTEMERMSEMSHIIGRDLFLLGRQASLDVRALPKIISGVRYDDFLTAKEWNEWMRGGAWEQYYPKADIDGLQMPEDGDSKRSPAVVVPGAVEKPEELLIRELDLIVPFGLLMISLRFVLRGLLALSGWIRVDPNAAHADDHEDDEDDRKDDKKPAAAKKAQGGAA